MIALALFRSGDINTPAAILKSLKETAIVNDELGMYWSQTLVGKNDNTAWFWWQAPIETQSLLIEAFQEIGKDTKIVDELKTWLHPSLAIFLPFHARQSQPAFAW